MTARAHYWANVLTLLALIIVALPVLLVMMAKREWFAAIAWAIIVDLMRRASKIGSH